MAYQSIESMRSDIRKVYDGPAWKNRVQYMSDSQVMAIWYRFESEGKFNKNTPVEKNDTSTVPVAAAEEPICVQLTFEDFMGALT